MLRVSYRPTNVRWLLGLAVVGLLLTACGTPQPRAEGSVEWQSVAGAGWSDTALAAVFLSTPVDSGGFTEVGYLGFIGADGHAKFVRTETGEGELASGRGVLCASTATNSYRITGSEGQRWRRGGSPGFAHWASVRPDGTCVTAFNTGRTEVFWDAAGKHRRCVVPDSPEAAGATGDAVWIANIASGEGRVKLYRCDLSTGDSAVAMTWRYWRGDPELFPRARYWESSQASNLFNVHGRLYYLEDVSADDARERHVGFKPGMQGMLRLASVDPRRHAYSSTFLGLNGRNLTDTPSGDVNLVATAAYGGHVSGGNLYVVDALNRILAIDLAHRSMRVAGRLSTHASRAVDAVASWDRGTLQVLEVDAHHHATLERYDLATGRRVLNRSVTGLSPLLQGDQLTLLSLATLG